MRPLYKPLKMILKKTAPKHAKSAHTVLTPLNVGIQVRYPLLFAYPGDTSFTASKHLTFRLFACILTTWKCIFSYFRVVIIIGKHVKEVFFRLLLVKRLGSYHYMKAERSNLMLAASEPD